MPIFNPPLAQACSLCPIPLRWRKLAACAQFPLRWRKLAACAQFKIPPLAQACSLCPIPRWRKLAACAQFKIQNSKFIIDSQLLTKNLL